MARGNGFPAPNCGSSVLSFADGHKPPLAVTGKNPLRSAYKSDGDHVKSGSGARAAAFRCYHDPKEYAARR